MSCACRAWALGRPRWAAWTEPGLAAAALAGLLYCLPLPYVVTIIFPALWLRRRNRRLVRSVSAGVLYACAPGGWRLEPARSAPVPGLRLTRFWAAPAWVTLRFSAGPGTASKETMLQVTIWKSSVPARAWRQLRLCLAGREGGVAAAEGR